MSDLRFRTRLVVSVAAACVAGHFTLKNIQPVSEGLRTKKAQAEEFLSSLENSRINFRITQAGRGKPDYWIARQIVSKNLTDTEQATLELFKTCSALDDGGFPSKLAQDIQTRAKIGYPLKIQVERYGQPMSEVLTSAVCPSSKDAMDKAEQDYMKFLKQVSDEEAHIAQTEVNAQAAISAYHKDDSHYTGELLMAAVEATVIGLFAFLILNPLSRLLSGPNARKRKKDGKGPEQRGICVEGARENSPPVVVSISSAPREGTGYVSSAMAGMVKAGDADVIPLPIRRRRLPRLKKDPMERGKEAVVELFGEMYSEKMIRMAENYDHGFIESLGRSAHPLETARIWFKINRKEYEPYVGAWFFTALGIKREEGRI